MKSLKNKKYTMFVLFLALCLCMLLGLKIETQAAAAYEIAKDNGVLTCTYNGILQRNIYLAVKQSGDTYTVTKPCTKNSKIYYFDADGKGKAYTSSKFIKVTYGSSKAVYYSKKGVLLTNTIAGNKTQGYYYVDSTGVRITSKPITQAVKFVRSHTKSSWSKSKKLKTCYTYLWKKYSYQRFYDTPKASKMSGYAKYMFTNKKGNCYRYAASLACIAKVIGYDSRVAVGSISSLHGGMTPHGWTEIKVSGKWYICDANMQKNFPSVNSYMRTTKTYAYSHKCSKRYTLTVKNGKVSWK